MKVIARAAGLAALLGLLAAGRAGADTGLALTGQVHPAFEIEVYVNGEPAAADIDLFNEAGRSVAATGPLDLGVFEPRDGVLTLRVEVVGANPRSAGAKHYFGLDCLVLTDAQD